MNNHCCETMKDQVNIKCKIHVSSFDCPDILITYNKKFDEYGLIIHDGGSSSIEITYCPWCGSKLPDSKRDLWFEILDQLGFDDPVEQSIPEEFKTDKWYKK
ncbi:DUF6980 family protein [Peribacillus sp. NPDC006672]|uniref:DUF6980 family protein n=1 Tax=Peribacillus sp. NPDC006672 TaxID=3390606 RepID=UPI003D055B95